MKYFVYNYKDIKLKVFDAPILTTEAPDVYQEKVERSLKVVKPFDYQFAKDKVLYYFGTFDDVEGKFDLLENAKGLLFTNEVLLPFEDVVKDYKASGFRDEKSDAIIYRLEFNAEREALLAKEKGAQNGGQA